MKKLMLLSFFFIGLNYSIGQRTEFANYPSGLMYNDATMNKLEHIVDSLNLKFKVCELDQVYYSKYQAKGHYIYLKKGNMKAAKTDMEQGISFDDFVKKYPDSEVQRNLILVKNRDEERGARFYSYGLTTRYEHRMYDNENAAAYDQARKGTWLFDYWKKGEYNDEKLSAVYFASTFEKKPLPETYARMIQYVDCMVDTSAHIYKAEAEYGDISLPEKYASMSFSEKENLLEQFRMTKVAGFCSQDDRPRIHARNIAILSAETQHWKTFLRSHLDIMNDRFERNSDGSYAQAGRKTYIRELEELEINVTDLLCGISLRIENPSDNHYFGSISRLGRALAETQKREVVEQIMLTMIKDDELDDFNRILIYYLFRNYNAYLSDEDRQQQNREKLKSAILELPDYLNTKVDFEKW